MRRARTCRSASRAGSCLRTGLPLLADVAVHAHARHGCSRSAFWLASGYVEAALRAFRPWARAVRRADRDRREGEKQGHQGFCGENGVTCSLGQRSCPVAARVASCAAVDATRPRTVDRAPFCAGDVVRWGPRWWLLGRCGPRGASGYGMRWEQRRPASITGAASAASGMAGG